MGLINHVGIVIGETEIKESSKMLTLLLKGIGKYSVLAKNVKNTKSTIASSCQLFSYSNFYLFEKNSLRTITKAEGINSFYKIREDYYSFCVASFFSEWINKSIVEEIEVDDILFLLFLALDNLNNSKNNKQVLLVFIVKFLQIQGDIPPVGFCHNCGENVENIGYFSKEGMLCQKCSSTNNFKLSSTEIYTLKYILNEEIKKVFRFYISDIYIDNLTYIFINYLKNNLDTKINALNLL